MNNPICTILFLLFFSSCGDTYVPKPRGFFRIDLPEQTYQTHTDYCPFIFEYHSLSRVLRTKEDQNNCWLNIDYPLFNATIHLSYKTLDKTNTINEMIEDARTLAYKHTIKAMDINETLILRDTSNVYGLVYTFEGNTATSTQFYITDSINHFLRGALYFNVVPNEDSLKPVATYLNKDLNHFLQTIRWK